MPIEPDIMDEIMNLQRQGASRQRQNNMLQGKSQQIRGGDSAQDQINSADQETIRRISEAQRLVESQKLADELTTKYKALASRYVSPAARPDTAIDFVLDMRLSYGAGRIVEDIVQWSEDGHVTHLLKARDLLARLIERAMDKTESKE